MERSVIQYCSGSSFIERQLFNFKVWESLKECESIKENLKKLGDIKREDTKIYVVIPYGNAASIKENYLIHRGYNKDGSIKPIRKHKLKDGRITEEDQNIPEKIIVLDLYERSLYLHNYRIDDGYASGYIVKELKESRGNLSMIFTNEEVKVDLRNVNAYHEYEDVDSFVDMFFM